MDEDPVHKPFAFDLPADDLPQEEMQAAKRQSKINALVLGLVFLLLTVAPHPWNMYAPLLFLISAVYSVVRRWRNASNTRLPHTTLAGRHRQDIPPPSPYEYVPKDPKDPRRYKPIG